jgi:hypothetical protein
MSGDDAAGQRASAHADLGRIRIALQARAEQTSLRSAAREVGMSPTGLQKVLDGNRPYRPTLTKLRGWHRRHLDGDHQTAQDLALEALLGGIPEARRERVRERIRTILEDETTHA